MADALLVIAPVLLPLAGSAVALLLRWHARAATVIGMATTAALAIVSALLLRRALDPGPIAATVFGGWPNGMGLSLSATLPGAALVLITALVALAAAIYALDDIGSRRRRAGYDALVLAMLGAVNGAFLTDDLFNLYVWFELALLCALGLLTLDRRTAQIDGAISYAAFGMLGATFILLGVGMIYGITGTLNIAQASAAMRATAPGVAPAVAAALLLGGLALKSGLVPFHLWLPISYHTAPTTVAALFAGLLTKMGFFALLALFAGVMGIASGAAVASHLTPLIAALAAMTMLICVTGALAQTDMRRILAYHVVAQVGYMMAGLALATRDGVAAAVFYMIHSMIVQANLFFGAGLIRRATGSWDLTRAGGMVRHQPLFALLFAVPVLSLAGIPPFSGFWAKLLIIRESLRADMPWIGVVALFVGLLTIVSMSIFWSDSCWKRSRRAELRPLPVSGLAAMALLSAATMVIGIFPHWFWSLARRSANALMGAS